MNQSEKITLTALAALALAAIAVQGAPRRIPGHPKAPKPKTVAVSVGDTISVNGVLYVVSATLIPAGSPPPPPPPPSPKLIGLTTSGPTFSAGAILSGTLTLDSPAPLGGCPVTLSSSVPAVLPVSSPVTVAAGATQGAFTATAGNPTTTTAVTLTGSAGGTSQTAAVTVLGSNATVMNIYGYRDGNRNPALNFGPGQTVFIEGVGFGATPGQVHINNNLIATQKWTESELQIVCPSLPGGALAGPCLLDVRRADGQDWNTTMGFVIIPPPTRPAGG